MKQKKNIVVFNRSPQNVEANRIMMERLKSEKKKLWRNNLITETRYGQIDTGCMFKHVEHLWNTPGSFFNLDSTFIRCIIFVYMHILLFSFRLKNKEKNNFAVEHMQIVCARCLSCSINGVGLSLADHRWHDFITSTIDNILWWSKSAYKTIWSRHSEYRYEKWICIFMVSCVRCSCPFLFFLKTNEVWSRVVCFVLLLICDRFEADAFKLQCRNIWSFFFF